MRTREIRKEMRGISLWMGILLLLIVGSVMPAFAATETITYDYYDSGAIWKAKYVDNVQIEYTYDASGNMLTRTVTLLAPDISSDPGSLDFGNVNASTTSPSQTITVTNNGTASLAIGTLSISGTDAGIFSQTNDCSTLLPSGSCNIDVTFISDSAGPKNATLSISSNDPDTLIMDVALTGTGVATLSIAVNPAEGGVVIGTGIDCPGDCTGTVNTSGASIQLIATAGTGYHFVSWSGNMGGSNNPENVLMDVNKSVTANFSISTYTISTTAGANGSINCTPNPVEYDSSSTCTISPNTGYHIASVTVDGVSQGATSPYVFDNVTAAHTIAATFALNDTTPTPPTGSISINNAADYTNSTSVTLTLLAIDPSGVSQMCISNTTDCTTWELYLTTKTWTLPAEDGAKTVYVWYQDAEGNANQMPYTDEIILDTTPPAPPIVKPVTSPRKYNDNIVFLSGTKDANSSIRVNDSQVVAVNVLTTWQTWGVPYSLQVGENTLEVTSRDAAGNASSPTIVSVELLPANVSDPDIVGLWHMDGNWLDYSGSNNHGTAYGGATFNPGYPGELAYSGSFDGLDDYVIVSSFNNFPSSEITVEFWMTSSDTTNEGVPISYAVPGSDNEFLLYNYKNFEICKSDSCVTTGVSANDGNWHYIAVTWSSNGETKLYKDGVLSYSGTMAAGTLLTQGGSLVFGAKQDSVGGSFQSYQNFVGLIDEVTIYKRVLSPEDILQNSWEGRYEPYADSMAPTGSIAINDSADYTNSPSVTLTLSATDPSGVPQMCISNTTDCTAWETFSATKSWALPAEDGAKTVYVWYKDGWGNFNITPFTTVVNLDSTPPDTAIIDNPSDPTSNTANFTFTSNDANSTFECEFDGGGYGPCTSPLSYTNLSEGSHTFAVKATDPAGNTDQTPAYYSWTIDTVAPSLIVSTLSDNAWTSNGTLNISGDVFDDGSGLLGLTINGVAAAVNPDSTFSHAVLLEEGANTITVIATDNDSNTTTDTRTINYDPYAPVIVIDQPVDNSKTNNQSVTVSGYVDEYSAVTGITNNLLPLTFSFNGEDGSFSSSAGLTYGTNTIEVGASDLALNTATAKRTVTYDNLAPSLAVTQPPQDISTSQSSLEVQGTVSDLTIPTVTMTVDGGAPETLAVTAGQFSKTVTFTSKKTYVIQVTAVDEAGNSSTVIRNIIYHYAPEANFNTSVNYSASYTVDFNASVTTCPSGYACAYLWDFDDDGNEDAAGITATHSFAGSGPYPVTLTVTTNALTVDSITKNVTPVEINVVKLPPTAAHTSLVSPVVKGSPVSFVDASQDNNHEFIASVYVNWGDGNVVYGAAAATFFSHTYANSGKYTIIHTATDAGGRMASELIPVQVTLTAGTKTKITVNVTQSDAATPISGARIYLKKAGVPVTTGYSNIAGTWTFSNLVAADDYTVEVYKSGVDFGNGKGKVSAKVPADTSAPMDVTLDISSVNP